MNECKACGHSMRVYNAYEEVWEDVCGYVVDHYQERPDSRGVDVYNTAGNEDGDCEYWEEK